MIYYIDDVSGTVYILGEGSQPPANVRVMSQNEKVAYLAKNKLGVV